MWLWEPQFKRLGFKRKSEGYWQCTKRYGLPAEAYLSAFVNDPPATSIRAYELLEFHVTFKRRGHRLHFYFHEVSAFTWSAGGHTSAAEIARLDLDQNDLLHTASSVAGELIASMGGAFVDD